MEEKDEALIQTLLEREPELRRYYEEHVDLELVLIKVRADERTRGELANIVDIFRAKIIDVSRESNIVEITGAEEKVNALVELLKPIGILEIVRTGKVAMYRGTRVLTVNGKDKERAA